MPSIYFIGGFGKFCEKQFWYYICFTFEIWLSGGKHCGSFQGTKMSIRIQNQNGRQFRLNFEVYA